MNIDELVRAAATAMNMPESMVRQSAEARAKAAGKPVEEILGAWAGVDPSADAPPAAPSAPEPPKAAPAEPPAPAPASAGAAGSGDLLAKAAAAQGMPEAMVKRSASARAKAEGKTTDEILAEWAGVELPEGGATPSPAEPAPAAEAPETAAPAAEAPAAAAPAADTGDLLAKAAAAQGLPEAMVRRSAAARAKAQGTTTEAVLAEWAGVEAPPAAAAPAPAAAEPAAVATPAAAESVAEIEVIAEEEDAAPPPPASDPEREMVTPSGALPRWLAALFVAVPLFAMAYAGFLPNGPNCGDAGRLAVDPVTGVAVNCDGSEYGAGEVDYFAIGADVFGVRCAVCHGANGGGVASFPPFIDGALAATFPEGSCVDHQQWVTLGSDGWPDPTYGANNKPVGGLGVLMPAFGNQLSEQELQAVVLYERVQFAGFPLESVKTDCGL